MVIAQACTDSAAVNREDLIAVYIFFPKLCEFHYTTEFSYPFKRTPMIMFKYFAYFSDEVFFVLLLRISKLHYRNVFHKQAF